MLVGLAMSLAMGKTTRVARRGQSERIRKLLQKARPTHVVNNILNRQLYGRCAKNPKAKTETRPFNNIHMKCRFALSSLIKELDTSNHIFMGFTMCGQYFISFIQKEIADLGSLTYHSLGLHTTYEYELFLWRFIPGHKLVFLSKHKIFNHLKGPDMVTKIMLMQFPKDFYKIVCYGLVETNPDLVYITILTLPSPKNCKHCNGNFSTNDESVNQGWCIKHGFIIDYMFSMSQAAPKFNPHISLAYPNHLIVSTGHHIHILNVSTSVPPQISIRFPSLVKEDDVKLTSQTPTHTFNDDAQSEVSESPQPLFNSDSSVDFSLEDFMDPEMETPKWIKKVVRQYSSRDFENCSFVSGQSGDDYSIPIEIPLLVQNLTEQRLDVMPELKMDQISEIQLIVTQRSFDCEQFIQRRAQKLCSEAHLKFLHCSDYDIKIIGICSINGHIICEAVIKIGAWKKTKAYGKPENFSAKFLFTWSIETDVIDIIELSEPTKLLPSTEPLEIPTYKIPKISFGEVLVLEYSCTTSKTIFRDFNNYYQIRAPNDE